MSFQGYVLVLLLFFPSLYACNARRLRIVDDQNGNHIGCLYEDVYDHADFNNIISTHKDISKELKQERKIKLVFSSARSLLGSPDAEKAPNSKLSDAEDVEVMDYAQPHRKPPIHNEKS